MNLKHKLTALILLTFCLSAGTVRAKQTHNTSETDTAAHSDAAHHGAEAAPRSAPAAHHQEGRETTHETASRSAGHGTAAEHGAHAQEAKHGPDAEHGEGHHAPPPFIYYANWVSLGIALIAVCLYILRVREKGKPKHEGLALANFLVLLVIILYVSNQFPEVQRHFDAASHQFVDGYHEASTIGFIKFVYKMTLGVLLMIYGIMGREDHH